MGGVWQPSPQYCKNFSRNSGKGRDHFVVATRFMGKPHSPSIAHGRSGQGREVGKPTYQLLRRPLGDYDIGDETLDGLGVGSGHRGPRTRGRYSRIFITRPMAAAFTRRMVGSSGRTERRMGDQMGSHTVVLIESSIITCSLDQIHTTRVTGGSEQTKAHFKES